MAAHRLAGLAIAPVGAGASIQLWHQLRPGTPVVALNASLPGVTGLSLVSPDNAAAGDTADAAHGRAGSRVSRFHHGTTRPDGRCRPASSFPATGVSAGDAWPRGVLQTDDARMSARRAAACCPMLDRPTSIITNSDYTAHAIYKAARELSLPVGPAISVIGHDDLPTSELLDPPLATIRVDRRQMGQALMARLLAEAPLGDFVAPVELVERDSLQPPETAPHYPPTCTDGQQMAAGRQVGNDA